MWSPRGEARACNNAMSADACKVECRAAAQLVEKAMAGLVPSLVLQALAESVRGADEKLDTESLSAYCGTSRRTLSRQLRDVGLPSPQGIIACGKILASSWLLVNAYRSVEAVALELGLGDSAALVHLYRRYLGSTPGDVRKRGGLAIAIRLLLDRRPEGANRTELHEGAYRRGSR